MDMKGPLYVLEHPNEIHRELVLLREFYDKVKDIVITRIPTPSGILLAMHEIDDLVEELHMPAMRWQPKKMRKRK